MATNVQGRREEDGVHNQPANANAVAPNAIVVAPKANAMARNAIAVAPNANSMAPNENRILNQIRLLLASYGGLTLQPLVFLAAFLTFFFSAVLFLNLQVDLLTGLHIFSVYGMVIMSVLMFIVVLAQPCVCFSNATLIRYLMLDIALFVLAVGLQRRPLY